jgi:hypothetical protein
VRLEGLFQLKNLVTSRIYDLPACRIVIQPTALPRATEETQNDIIRKCRGLLSTSVLRIVRFCEDCNEIQVMEFLFRLRNVTIVG